MGSKSLAQIPARRNGPVSYDVRPRPKAAYNIIASPINSFGVENNTDRTGRTLEFKYFPAVFLILLKSNVPSFNLLAGRGPPSSLKCNTYLDVKSRLVVNPLDEQIGLFGVPLLERLDG